MARFLLGAKTRQQSLSNSCGTPPVFSKLDPLLPRVPLRKPSKLHKPNPFPPVSAPAGEPDHDSNPLSSLAMARLRIGMAKAGQIRLSQPQLSLLTYRL